MNKVFLIGQHPAEETPDVSFRFFINAEHKDTTRWTNGRNNVTETPKSSIQWMDKVRYNKLKIELIYD